MPLDAIERTRLGRGRQPAGPHRRARRVGLGRAAQVPHHPRPASAAQYRRFLPGGRDLPRLQALVRHWVGLEFAWDLRLVLARADVPRLSLGRAGQPLGHSSWLGRYTRDDDAGDLCIDVERVRARTAVGATCPSGRLLPLARSGRCPDRRHDPGPPSLPLTPPLQHRRNPMSEISRVALFGKLNPMAYKAIESATVFCKMRGNPYVELVHWFAQLLQTQGTDLEAIVRHYQLDASAWRATSPPRWTACPAAPPPSPTSTSTSRTASSALGLRHADVRPGPGAHRLPAAGHAQDQGAANALQSISRQFERIKADDLAENFHKICGATQEATLGAQDGSGLAAGTGGEPGTDSGAMAPAAMGKQEALKKFCVDLTERAREGKMDPVTGRDEEIRQIVDILMRRRQNNPILTGEAGVGKTAVVEGFAQRSGARRRAAAAAEVSLLSLDLGLLQAGASMKGEFEQRLRQVIDEVQASPKPIILFIDEVHTLVGAGGAAGTGDAANLLKPALARGNLRTIGATTWAEYKKYIEKDPALTRRFQVVQVPEPDEHKAILMLRGVASVLEKHHRVQLLDEAIESAVTLSHRYIPARQLPDKAVSLLDTACARVAVSQHATPAEVEDCQRRIEALEIERASSSARPPWAWTWARAAPRWPPSWPAERERLTGLEKRWKDEKAIVDRILATCARAARRRQPADGAPAVAEATAAPDARDPAGRAARGEDKLAALQGERR
jgi:type VI secretion system protein VasG